MQTFHNLKTGKCFIILLVVVFLCTACNAPTSHTNETVVPNNALITPSTLLPRSFTVADLLMQALSRYQAGDYEEAILAYLAIIEIEPKNFDAQLGLGQAYRQNKQSDKAIDPLKEALNLRLEDRPAAIELGYAYLDTGEYAETEKLARELLGDRMPDLSPMPTQDFEERETLSESVPISSLSDEVGEVLTLLLLSLGGQEKTEDMQALLNNEAFYKYLGKTISDNNLLYTGQYNAAGKREGKGVGIYPNGFLYVGEYVNDVRSGRGRYLVSWGVGNENVILYRRYTVFEGEWANDMPNGYGNLITWEGHLRLEGTYVDGKEHGTFTVAWGDESRGTMTSINGKRKVVGQWNHPEGILYDVWAYAIGSDYSSDNPRFFGSNADSGWDLGVYGIEPWGCSIGDVTYG